MTTDIARKNDPICMFAPHGQGTGDCGSGGNHPWCRVVWFVLEHRLDHNIVATGGVRAAADQPKNTDTGAPASPITPSSDTPKSKLINLTLPPGTTAIGGTPVSDMEFWLVRSEAPETVTTLQAELPVNQPVDGLAPCGEETNPKLESTQWTWSTGPNYLMVHVAPSPYYPKVGVRAPGSEVSIERGTDDSQSGCSGGP